MINVKITNDYGQCGHAENGCSGWEQTTIFAEGAGRSISVSRSSCFGVSMEELIAELLTKWNEV